MLSIFLIDFDTKISKNWKIQNIYNDNTLKILKEIVENYEKEINL
jgi:hypothetical protein